jgi:hypothetical protein
MFQINASANQCVKKKITVITEKRQRLLSVTVFDSSSLTNHTNTRDSG